MRTGRVRVRTRTGRVRVPMRTWTCTRPTRTGTRTRPLCAHGRIHVQRVQDAYASLCVGPRALDGNASLRTHGRIRVHIRGTTRTVCVQTRASLRIWVGHTYTPAHAPEPGHALALEIAPAGWTIRASLKTRIQITNEIFRLTNL